MSRGQLVLAVFLVGYLCGTIAEARTGPIFDERDNVEATSFGFRVASPGKSWGFDRTTPNPGSLMLKISHKQLGNKVQFTILAEPAAEKGSPRHRRDTTWQKTEAKSEFSNTTKGDFQVGGKSAPGLTTDWQLSGENYRVKQCYFESEGMAYTLSYHAPVARFDDFVDAFDQVSGSFEFVPIADEVKRLRRIKTLAARCGSELDWAKTWTDAAETARSQDKAIMVVIRLQPGFDLSDSFVSGPLMDPDVVELVKHFFVPLRYHKGMQAPIVSHEKYGMGPYSFGYTILLAEPDGTVFGDTFGASTPIFHEFLLNHIRRHSQFQNFQPPDELGGVALARWYATRGRFDKALELTSADTTVASYRLRAAVFRQKRDADAALAELRAAAQLNDNSSRADLMVDEAIIQVRAGNHDRALQLTDDLVTDFPNHRRAPEALYWRGICRLQRLQTERAKNDWSQLIESYGDTRWAWKAAAMLTSTSFAMGLAPKMTWPDQQAIEALGTPAKDTSRAPNLRSVRTNAKTYLLRRQRDDGSWISPMDELGARGYNTSTFTAAVTSICARSLLDYREQPSVLPAIKRSVSFLIDWCEREKETEDKPYYMDYSPWGNSFTLLFLADCVRADLVDRGGVEPAVNQLVARLRRKQKKGGGWSYYVTRNLKNAGQSTNQSCSFMTATATISLLACRDAGFDIPPQMTDAALDCLESMRNRGNTFDYFLWHDHQGRRGIVSEEGAAGRGPVCSLALYQGGRGSLEQVRMCLDLFVKHSASYARETGKSLMHAAPGSQGSHYLMFDYLWASAAIDVLPAKQRQEYRTKLTEMILQARSIEGSYLDNPINGWHYGTGMALYALRDGNANAAGK